MIVGGGTAGWMAAAALAKCAGTQQHSITLIESGGDRHGRRGRIDDPADPGCSIACSASTRTNSSARPTRRSSSGSSSSTGSRSASSYFHNFGLLGADLRTGIPFIHYWLRWAQAGGDPDQLLFSSEARGRARRQVRPRAHPAAGGNQPNINYAFQFDASTYAAYLRRYSERRGVVRREGKVVDVRQNPETGFIEAVVMDDGSTVRGDFFIDCSGFRGLLIEQVYKAGLRGLEPLAGQRSRRRRSRGARWPSRRPYTVARARDAGWQWRIPLQHRTGNGYVFAASTSRDDEAVAGLLEPLEGKALADPKVLRFKAGRRKASWIKNCLALGLVSGFLEPLESTSIHLVQAAITKFLDYLPDRRPDPILVDRFNDEMEFQYETIRDFIIAHYKVTEREDTEFWRYCKHMSIPDTLVGEDRAVPGSRRGEAAQGRPLQRSQLVRDAVWPGHRSPRGIIRSPMRCPRMICS